MVTIDPDLSISITTGVKGANDRLSTEKSRFDEALRDAVGSSGPNKAQMESASFNPGIRPARFEAQATPSTHMIVDQVSDLIDTMQAYQEKLAENGATLRDIQPLVDKMAGQGESLRTTSRQIGDDNDLKVIVEQSLSLSSMEITRFKSGQYNDASI